nr:AraC family transcriptional regulator [uncultured Macellibacteroides sp.]
MANLFEKGVTASFKECLLNYDCVFKKHVVGFNGGFSLPEMIENCILFVQQGSFKILNDPTKEVVVNESEMVFIPPFTPFKAVALNLLNLISFSFDNNISFCNKLSLTPHSITCESSTDGFKVMNIKTHLQVFLTGVFSYLDNNIGCTELFFIKQAEFFFIMKTYYTQEEIVRFFCSILCNNNDFKRTVLNNYTKDSSVSELAAKNNMSVKTFTRRFKENFGETPYQWIIKQNVKEIRLKLADPDIQIKDIAYEFGFASASHFTNFCKTQMNESPQEIREKLNDYPHKVR